MWEKKRGNSRSQAGKHLFTKPANELGEDTKNQAYVAEVAR
jgi:hypothetical protein